MTHFHLTKLTNPEKGFTYLSTSKEWKIWLDAVIPDTIDQQIHNRLSSNLKHILLGLEMKAGLILPHAYSKLKSNQKALLFEPYHQILTFEFCLGTWSVCEGLGTAHHLANHQKSGRRIKKIRSNIIISALTKAYSSNNQYQFELETKQVRNIRNMIHQDNLFKRDNIDWHALGYQAAFIPALNVLSSLFETEKHLVPKRTNLITK